MLKKVGSDHVRGEPMHVAWTLVRGEPSGVVVGSWSEESKGYGPYAGVQHAYVRPEDDIHQQNRLDYVKFP